MHTCRTRFKKDIIAEFLPPKNRKSQKVMIFCSGVPGSPDKDDVLEFFAKKGYWTFFPRYRGTWESNGVFLKYPLEEDILIVIDCLEKHFEDLWTGKKYRVKARDITIVGTSFGGPVGILNSRDPRVNRSICISPVVDWQAENKVEPLSHLYDLIKDAYGGAYRLKRSYWNRLVKGRFYNPVNHIHEFDGRKIMIFHAQDDDIVPFRPVAKFADTIDCHKVFMKKGGHLSSSLLTEKRYYQKVKKFLAQNK